jgi:signal transduction histidine kinase
MKILSKIILKAKLLILVLLPFIVLGVFTFDKISNEKKLIAKMTATRVSMDQIEKMSSLTHEFQKERDFATNFLLNPQYHNQVQLEKQVEQTDSIILEFRNYLINEMEDTTHLSFFNDLKEVRANLTGFSLGPREVQTYYNKVIGKFLSIVSGVGSEINTPLTKEEMKAYLSLVQTKENLGKIRNSVNEALIFGQFQRLGYGEFSGYKGAFKYNLDAFVNYSPTELKSRFIMDLEGGTMLNTLQMIDYCFETETNRLVNFTASDWWFSATGTMNVLHELEQFVINRVKISLKTQEEKLQSEIDNLYIMLFGVLTIVLLMVSFIAKSITSDLQKIENAAQNLKDGKTNVNVSIHAKDEIGKLALAFNRMALNSNMLANVAEKIGEGDYDVDIVERSDEDVLSKALIQMKGNLKITTSELKRKFEELEQSYKYKTDFLANMSHELRTPLNSMLILSKLLAENKDGNLSEEEVTSSDVIYQSGSNLLELINDILDSSKIEAAKLEIEKRDINLPKTIEHIYHLFKPVSIENKLNFSVVQSNPIPDTISSDELRLGQILKNLISNAMKFTPSGGAVTLNITFEKDEIEFTVTDTGIGVPKDKQESIFGAFNQADGSTSRHYGGTGLGLSITANLVKLLDGTINLESDEGAGSKFIVRLPVGTFESNKMVTLPKYKSDFVLGEANGQAIIEPSVYIQEEPPGVTEKVKVLFEHYERFNTKRMIIIDDDISNVFDISSKLIDLQMNIEEASTLLELKEKMLLPFDVVLINFDSITNDELNKMETILFKVQKKTIEVGSSKNIRSLSNVNEILSEMLKLSN